MQRFDTCPPQLRRSTTKAPRTVHLDKGTYMWVHLTRFTIDPEVDDAELINALVAHRAFRVSFWDGDELGEE